MKTGIVILNYNSVEDTKNCIDSVLKYNTADVKFVVVDNGSPNSDVVPQIECYLKNTFKEDMVIATEKDSVPTCLPTMTYYISSTNTGYADGNNKGLKLLYADKGIKYILILNSDILFIEDIIPSLISALNENKDAAIVSPLLYKKDKAGIDYNCARIDTNIDDLIARYRYSFFGKWNKLVKLHNKRKLLISNPSLLNEKYLPIELPSGSCMLVQKDYFQQIGGFDSNTFLYFEENILWAKVKKTGKVNYLCSQLSCIHLGASSTKKVKGSYKKDVMHNKSVRYYVEKYVECPSWKKWIFYTYRILFLIRQRIYYLVKR